jgi:hypothetical protein
MLMNLFKTALLATATTMLVASGARADDSDKLTYMTFSAPVQIPGMVLPAGTYEFKLAIPEGNRRVVQVSDKETKKTRTIVLTIPNRRMKPADEPVVMFAERPSGEAPAVQVWFYPGETYGYEFVYPREQALKIAKATHTPVASFEEDSKSADAQALSTAGVTYIDESGEPTGTEASANRTPPAAPAAVGTSGTSAVDQTPAENRQQSGAENRQQVGARQEPAANSQEPAANARTELPRTGGPLALVGLLSGLSLGGALGVRALRVRLER